MRTWLLLLTLIADITNPPNMFLTMKALRANYPTPMSRDQLSMLLNSAAKIGGWKMLRQDQGDNCPTPYAQPMMPMIRINCQYLVDSDFVATQILNDINVSAEPLVWKQVQLSSDAPLVEPW